MSLPDGIYSITNEGSPGRKHEISAFTLGLAGATHVVAVPSPSTETPYAWTVQKTADGKYRVSGASPVGILGTDGVGWLVIPDYTGVEWTINEVRGDNSTYTIETEYAGGNRAWTVPPLGQGTIKVTLEPVEDGPTATQRFTFIPANQ